MSKKLIPIYILIILAVAVLSAVITSNVPAFQSLLSGTKLYTPEMVKEVEDEAYNKGLSEKENLLLELSHYKSSLEKVSADKKILEDTLTLKQNELNILKNNNFKLTEDILLLESEVKDLQNQITTFELDIEYYKELLEAYENIEKRVVTFKVDDSIYDVQLVNDGGYMKEVLSPTYTNYKFLGWSIDGIHVINDITSIQVLNDITLVALKIEVFNVSYNVQGSEVYLEEVELNDYSSYSTIPTLNGWSFYGWSTSTSKEDIVDLSSLNITEDIVLNAIFTKSALVSENPVVVTLSYSSVSASFTAFKYTDFKNICNVNLINSGYEFCVDITYKHKYPNGDLSGVRNIKLTEQLTMYDLKGHYGDFGYDAILPFYITTDNVLVINSKDGSNPFITFGEGSNIFEINSIQVYTF